MTDRHLVDVHVVLLDDHGRVLLSRRRDPDPRFDGLWHLPSGKLDAGESVLEATVREADEEIGVHLDPADLRHVHTIHINGMGREPRLGLFFVARRWAGEPANREPHKCYGLDWFPLDDLPKDIIGYPAAGLDAYRAGRTFSVRGWPNRDSGDPRERETTGQGGD
ncbi:MAG TPA: NUDIX domain-containing protein [Amycolatopsis sp.]|jgi:8-oxo-dGTP pyrophosphatase MutT (NUDIX family)|nr:NUDIX domain-containing protein [Amycolatopsis sp.]